MLNRVQQIEHRTGAVTVAELRPGEDQLGLRIDPCIPKHWPGFQLTYRRRGRLHAITRFEITVDNSALVGSGVTRIELDGSELSASADAPLADDGRAHTLRITIGQTKVSQ